MIGDAALRGRSIILSLALIVLVGGFTQSSPQAFRAAPLMTSQASSSIMPVIDRPEIRSYQPYSGLQQGFRPLPPVQRGVRTLRPKIIAPKPVAPLILYGPPYPYVAQGYSYCPDPLQPIEPREGPYGPRPIGPRQCP